MNRGFNRIASHFVNNAAMSTTFERNGETRLQILGEKGEKKFRIQVAGIIAVFIKLYPYNYGFAGIRRSFFNTYPLNSSFYQYINSTVTYY